MKRVLVTGATGFIGRHSLPGLTARGYTVHGLSSLVHHSTEGGHNAVHWHQIDLRDVSTIAPLIERIQPTYLLHFAWNTEPGRYWRTPDNLTWVQASIEILKCFAANGGQRVVFAGTCAEYDWRYGFCVETQTPLLPATLYGTSKHALHLLAQAYTVQIGLSLAWGRVFFVYGPHEHPKRLVPSLVRGMLQHEDVPCSHGNQIRDFLHVQDVADAFVALLDSEVIGAVNIGSGQPIKIREIAFKIASYFQSEHLLQIGALHTAPDDPPLLVADVRRLVEEVKWKPHYNLDTGLAHTIEWWRTQGDYSR